MLLSDMLSSILNSTNNMAHFDVIISSRSDEENEGEYSL